MSTQQERQGQLIQADFYDSVGGLNISDSPFAIKDTQNTGGFNYEYVKTGGIVKSLGPALINPTPDTQLLSLGIGLRNDKNSNKTIIRAAGTKIQSVDLGGNFVNLTRDDATSSSDFFPGTSTNPVPMSMFINAINDILWLDGGGLDGLYGVYSTTKVTKNGVAEMQGIVSATVTNGFSTFPTAPTTYFYAFALHKKSTGALSNAALDVEADIVNTTDQVVLNFSGITPAIDTTTYDQIYIYRSHTNGVTGFTTGDLIATIPSTQTTYTDDNSGLVSPEENIPRSGNPVLDNSVLPDGEFDTITYYKSRLVVSQGSTIYISDVNKPESWPQNLRTVVPSGGKVTALGIQSFTTPTSLATDNLLAIWKENELWIITGTTVNDLALQFIDSTGCVGQKLVVSANGYIYWINQQGVYLWDGAGKPIYISRVLEPLFGADGDIDKNQLYRGVGAHFKRQNEVIWFLSNGLYGTQKYVLKLDLRLTLPSVSDTLGQRILDGVFNQGTKTNPVFAASAFYFPTSSSQEEILISGDDAGNVYRQYYDNGSIGNDVNFQYETKFLDMGSIGTAKRFYKVVVWVDNLGNWPLTLDFWSNYRDSIDTFSSISINIPQSNDPKDALWDIAFWDEALWDNFSVRPVPLVYNLYSPIGNTEGDCIKLRFRQQGTDNPVTINGFSVIYSVIGLRK